MTAPKDEETALALILRVLTLYDAQRIAGVDELRTRLLSGEVLVVPSEVAGPNTGDTGHHAWHFGPGHPTRCVPCLGVQLGIDSVRIVETVAALRRANCDAEVLHLADETDNAILTRQLAEAQAERDHVDGLVDDLTARLRAAEARVSALTTALREAGETLGMIWRTTSDAHISDEAGPAVRLIDAALAEPSRGGAA